MSQPNRVLLVALAAAIVMAIAETLIPSIARQTSAVDAVAAISFAVCAFAWVKADARARKIKPPPGSALLAALIIPIGVPVYLFRARGMRSGFLGSLKAFGFFLAVAVTYVAVSYVSSLLFMPQ